MGKISDFSIFVQSHVAFPKACSKCWRCSTFGAVGQRNKTTSSTYNLVHILIGSAPIRVSNPSWVAFSRNFCSGSMVRMNSIGDSGSPCRSPRPCLIGFLGSPLRRILDEVWLHISAIMLRHRCPNPTCSMNSKRYSHHTLSKALAMSSLISSIGVLAR
jgi:hypothetical protein